MGTWPAPWRACKTEAAALGSLCPSNSAPAGDGTGCHSDVALYRHTELAREGQGLAPVPWVLAAASWRLEAKPRKCWGRPWRGRLWRGRLWRGCRWRGRCWRGPRAGKARVQTEDVRVWKEEEAVCFSSYAQPRAVDLPLWTAASLSFRRPPLCGSSTCR